LAAQAANYQDAINQLDQQIALLQQSIVSDQLKSEDLQKQIDQAQTDLNHEKQVLGENIKAMYLEGNISTLEILASSNNISDFVNKQEYRNSVQSKVKTTLDKINALKLQLTEQQKELDTDLANLKTQQSQLSSTQAQQAQMLAYTEGEKAAYDQQASANQSQINKLRQQLIALNTAGSSGTSYGGACGGGYPGDAVNPYTGAHWGCNYAQDNAIDNWGMYNRECVSYTAWKEAATGHYVPYGLGNAGDWIYNVPSSWVSQTPQEGDVAIRPANPNLWFGSEQDVGHAMYVEGVNGDGTISVSQYNANLNGQYSYVASKSTAGLYFIHFPTQ
jgi:surface antigen